MNYSMDNKIWRVGGPLFTYLGINFLVKLCFYIGLFYVQFKELNVNAAFNGVLYAKQLNENEKIYAVLISGLAALISIPIFIRLMKNDYEYPVNRRHKERTFDMGRYTRSFDKQMLPLLLFIGVFATLGLSRLILMIPLDGILGNYSNVKETYEAGNVWIQLIMLGIVTPVAEELLFRGLVYKRLQIYYDVTVAGYISSIIFGIVHFNLVQGIYAFIMGILFAYVYEKFNNIYASIIIHISANIAAIITSINPIGLWIEEYVLVKFVLALIETGVFIQLVVIMYKKLKKKEEAKSQEIQELENSEATQTPHKIDFQI